jgi:predicted transcriptional regulator
MTPHAAKAHRRIGRPPAGARDGEKVKDYPQLSIRLPADVKAKLQALSVIESRPQWRVITDAIECYASGRPDAERLLIDQLAIRSRGRATRANR